MVLLTSHESPLSPSRTYPRLACAGRAPLARRSTRLSTTRRRDAETRDRRAWVPRATDDASRDERRVESVRVHLKRARRQTDETAGRMTPDEARARAERAVRAMVSSSATFAAMAWTTQRLGLMLGVGCGAPLVGGAASAASVCAASAAAGAAARAIVGTSGEGGGGGNKHRRLRGGGGGRRRAGTISTPFGELDEDDAARDVGVGVAAFAAAARGRLGTILPSDVSRVGANAKRSIAARGSDYASDAQKRTLQRWFNRDGCHHCGSARGKVIGDHMPPNKTAFGSGARAAANRRASTLRRIFNHIRGVPLQRFYPQCESCSALQSVAVRAGAVRLVSHSVGVRCAVIAGAVVGVATLHYDDVKARVDDVIDRARRLIRDG